MKSKTKAKLLETKFAAEGFRFLRTLEYLHANRQHPLAGLITEDFRNNREVVASMVMFGGGSYRNLPSDVKTFISRCANLKKKYPRRTMHEIAHEQYFLAFHQSDKLYCSVMQMLHEHHLRVIRLEEWYVHAEKNPIHSYHPEELE